MNVFFVDKHGTSGVIRNDLTIDAEEPISEEVEQFLERAKRSQDGTSPTIASLAPGFMFDLYLETSVMKVEQMSTTHRAEWTGRKETL